MKFLYASIAASALALVVLASQLVPTTPVPSGKNSAGKPAAATLIRNVRVFDGGKTWPRASVLVRAGRIEAIAETLSVPSDAEVVDGRGKTLLPGLIDAHVHSWGDARREALRFGVTTELDMFTDHRQLAAARRERAALAPTQLADLWSAGTLATAAGGHGTQYGLSIPTLSGPDSAPAWVAARQAEGSDYIKLVREDLHVYSGEQTLPSLDAATAAALINAAHAAGLRALVHASAQEAARESLRDGADGLVHVFQDQPADPELVALAKQRQAFVVPTLTVVAGFSGERTTLADDPRITPFLSAGQRQSLIGGLRLGSGQQALIANARESVRRLHIAGVVILAGTDAPNPNTAHGAALHEELAQLVRAGLSPTEALAAATSRPAKAFGLDDRGRIAAGLRADLVLVDGDPTADITRTRAIAAIWKNGARVERDLEAEPVAGKLRPGVIGRFDAESADAFPDAGWLASTDGLIGGSSTVSLRRVSAGAGGSAGALRLSGQIVADGGWPWAGAIYSPSGKKMQPVDARSATELRFRARGDGREYSVLLLSGAEARAAPATLRLRIGPQWTELRLPLADFAGADLARLRAVGIAAGAPSGRFELDIDDVEIR